jgi:NADPH-dependent 2,4-dienoyl-CoA reductase/sulfur reductase-like enzyme
LSPPTESASTPTPHYDYLIAGGGMAAHAAIHGIREVDPDGSIGLIGFERQPPYRRAPLSKGLWTGEPVDTIWYPSDRPGVELHLGRRVTAIEPAAHRATDGRGAAYTYGGLLVATGSRPRRLPFGEENVIYYRTADDYQRLRALVEAGERFALVGGTTVAMELAAALCQLGRRVTLAFPEAGEGTPWLPPHLVDDLRRRMKEGGIEVVPHTEVTGVERRGDKILVTLRPAGGGEPRELLVDGVVADFGTEPNVEAARDAGLAVDPGTGGLLVDAHLRTNQPDIYAAGDVASPHFTALEQRLRVETEDGARQMGLVAGRNMARHRLGQPLQPFDLIPWYASDVFNLHYEAVGWPEARLSHVTHGDPPHEPSVTYFLDRGRVRGVVLWNLPGQAEAARCLVAETGPFDPVDLKGRLPAEDPPDEAASLFKATDGRDHDSSSSMRAGPPEQLRS